MRNAILTMAALGGLALAASPAFAHAHLEKATPAVGGTVSSPTELRLEFSEGVEPKFSKVTVTGPAGAAALGAAKTEGSEGATLVVPIADRSRPAPIRCIGAPYRSIPIGRREPSASP